MSRLPISILLLAAACANQTQAEPPEPLADRDAKPIVRTPPVGYEPCFDLVDQGLVALTFDVDENGNATNAVIDESTHPCFEPYALQSVENWRYEPKMVAGRPTLRQGMKSSMSFVADDVPADSQMPRTLGRTMTITGRLVSDIAVTGRGTQRADVLLLGRDITAEGDGEIVRNVDRLLLEKAEGVTWPDDLRGREVAVTGRLGLAPVEAHHTVLTMTVNGVVAMPEQ